MTTDSPRPGPRWYFFPWFAVVSATHLAVEGWTDTAAIGLPVGFAATLALVFVRRLPWWVTGDPRPSREDRRRRRRVAVVVLLWLVVAAAIVTGLVEHPPHGADVWNAAVFVAIFLGASVCAAVWLVPRRSRSPRATLRRQLLVRTAAAWTIAVLAAGTEVVTIVVTGGWLPWLLPVPAVLGVLGLVEWRAEIAGIARCLASGDWTSIPAAAFDVRPGEPVNGWAILPGDVRIKFHLPAAPADIAAELAGRRRLWLAGWPSEQLVTGLPDGDSYAIGQVGVHHAPAGDRKNTVPAGAGRR
ncbi:hypothetical protein [Amycolatopsis sp. NPDC051128]|uniref:hypothetical protein n=1 Tax=Amycolatopsis sp. NPDC051128 TaxID=3155412 RepID=UPI00342A43DC